MLHLFWTRWRSFNVLVFFSYQVTVVTNKDVYWGFLYKMHVLYVLIKQSSWHRNRNRLTTLQINRTYMHVFYPICTHNANIDLEIDNTTDGKYNLNSSLRLVPTSCIFCWIRRCRCVFWWAGVSWCHVAVIQVVVLYQTSLPFDY